MNSSLALSRYSPSARTAVTALEKRNEGLRAQVRALKDAVSRTGDVAVEYLAVAAGGAVAGGLDGWNKGEGLELLGTSGSVWATLALTVGGLIVEDDSAGRFLAEASKGALGYTLGQLARGAVADLTDKDR